MEKLTFERCLKILDLKGEPTFEVVRKRYRELVLKYHPDRNQSTTSIAKFREVVEAYGWLMEFYKYNYNDEDIFSSLKRDRKLMELSSEELFLRLKYSKSPHVKRIAAIALSLKGNYTRDYLILSLDTNNRDVVVTILNLLFDAFDLKIFSKLIHGLIKIKYFDLKIKGYLKLFYLSFREMVLKPGFFKEILFNRI